MEIIDLPEDIIIIIFSFLNIKNIGQVSLVCRQWARLAKDYSLWSKVDLRNQNNFKRTTWNEDKVMLIIQNYMSNHTTDLVVESTITSWMLKKLSTDCPNLRQLALFACHLDGTSPYMGRLDFSKLKTLDWRMTNGFLTEISHLSVECWQIENLGLGQRLTGVSSERLFTNQPYLKILDCQGSHFITDRSLEILANNCPNLVSVSFINCLNLRGNTLPTLMSGCRKLQTLRVRGNRLGDSGFRETNWKETSLVELDLQDVHNITDTTLVVMLLSLPRLTYLRCPVTDNILSHLRCGFPEIQVLKLHSNCLTSRDKLTAFLCACPSLTVLDISTEPVNAEQFATFLPCLPNMKYFSMAGDRDTTLSVGLLELFCPLLQVLSIQFYHALTNNTKLSDALVNLVQTNQHIRMILVSGINIKPTIEETRLALEGKLGTRRVDVMVDEYFEGMEVIPPINSLDGILKSTFHDYQVISEKRLPSSRIASVMRFLSQRQQ